MSLQLQPSSEWISYRAVITPGAPDLSWPGLASGLAKIQLLALIMEELEDLIALLQLFLTRIQLKTRSLKLSRSLYRVMRALKLAKISSFYLFSYYRTNFEFKRSNQEEL